MNTVIAFFAAASFTLPQSGTIPGKGILVKGPPAQTIYAIAHRRDGSQFEVIMPEQQAGYLFVLPASAEIYTVEFVHLQDKGAVSLGIRRYTVR